MPNKKLRIVSRQSPLAIWQAEHVRDCLLQQHPDHEVVIIGVTTVADRFLHKSLASMGGKGMFVKELEQALLSGEADLAVHSMKDVTVDLPAGLALPVIMQREDPTDVFVSNEYQTLASLPVGARVGTSSLRRQCQLKAWRADLQLIDIRGNVNTRLAKLDHGDYDALILAAAGVKRLGMSARISEYISVQMILPAVGQGALGIEIRADDQRTVELVTVLNDDDTHTCVSAERALSRRLYGGCHLPIAGFASVANEQLSIQGLVGKLDGSELIRHEVNGLVEQAEPLGTELGDALLSQGADVILQEIMANAGK